MSTRTTAVKPTYKPIKNDELKPVALIYKGLLNGTGVHALFTAEDATVDAAWDTAFLNSINAVGTIVPSSVQIKTNKDLTKKIKDNSKNCVAYGKKLTYWLKKVFPNSPGLIESFPIVPANDKMRSGDTEGLLELLDTICEQIIANQTDLVAGGYPVTNLTDYQALHTLVESVNTQQELAKKLVPENTDAATTVRNTCYGFIQQLVSLKELVYADDNEKKRAWAVATQLNQIRGGH